MKIEYDDPDISEFLAAFTKQFCPWCGASVVINNMGRKKNSAQISATGHFEDSRLGIRT